MVLPFVPVTETMGTRVVAPAGKSMSTTAPATSRGVPSEGATCMRKPGAAFTSTIPPPTSAIGFSMVGEITSIPAMSRPTIRAIRSIRWTFEGWTRSVTSREIPPVERLAVDLR